MAYFISLTLILALLLLWGSSCQAGCLVGNNNQSLTLDDAVKHLRDARFNFALDSLLHMSEIEKEDNIFYSPYSMHKALGLLYLGSRGDTEATLHKALRLPEDFSKLDYAYSYIFERSFDLLRNENSSKAYEYRSANRLWLSKAKKLRKCLINFFGGELRPTDFKTDPEATRQQINQWVEKVTRGNIKNFFGAIAGNTDAVIVNAVYFKGAWQKPFDPDLTEKNKFYFDENNTTYTQFMLNAGTFNYTFSQKLGAEILQLAYKGDDISMHILLPPLKSFSGNTPARKNQHETDSVHQLLNRITNSSGEGAKELRDILENGVSAQEIDLAIPKFNLERELPYTKLLMAMGAGLVPDFGGDFSGFVADGETSVNLGSPVHKAKIEVNEEGTIATAADGWGADFSESATTPPYFRADHPFVYFIYDRPNQAVLFAGIFRDPNST